MKFSAPERADYQQRVEEAWRERDEQVIKDVAGLVTAEEQIRNLDASKRRAFRNQFLPALVRILDANSGKSVHSWLRSYYRGAQTERETIAALDDKQTEHNSEGELRVKIIKDGGTLADLTGKWERKRGGGRYQGADGRHLGSSGNLESFEFSDDGRVAYQTLIAVQNASCRQEAFARQIGLAAADGNDLTINFAAGTIRNDDTCAGKSYTKTLPAAKSSYKWNIQKDEYDAVSLCLTDARGEELCYK